MKVPALGLLLVTTMTVSGDDVPPLDYEFVPDVKRRVGIDRGGYTLVGRLDEDGEFVAEKKLVYIHDPSGISVRLGSGPAFQVLNRDERSSKVYEYRSGLLIPGDMADGGKFVPEEGGVVVKFANYKYSATARRIWNLPGYFRLKQQVKGRAMDP